MNAIFRRLIPLLAVTAAGCSWVDLSSSGKQVEVLSAQEVSGCQHMGQTTVTTKSSVAGIDRNRGVVKEELRKLARNSAQDVGGDTVVPRNDEEQGRQTFDIYRCR